MEDKRDTIFLVLKGKRYRGYSMIKCFVDFKLALKYVEKRLLIEKRKGENFKRVSKTAWLSKDKYVYFTIVRYRIYTQ